METIKSYTTIEQSKKLAEILPIESADMYYQHVLPKSDKIKHNPEIGNPVNALKWYNKGYTASGKEPITLDEYCIPCWSLAALLRLMPFQFIENNNRFGFYQIKGFNKQGETYRFGYKTNNNSFLFETSWYNDSVDAAFEMICWLKENNKI